MEEISMLTKSGQVRSGPRGVVWGEEKHRPDLDLPDGLADSDTFDVATLCFQTPPWLRVAAEK